MNRYNRNYGYRYYNNYNNNYYNYNDYFPEVARLSYGFLNQISRRTGRYINPAVFDPNEKRRHFRINCHAKFTCYNCGNIWTSNQVTVELWWSNGKRQFDVRIYGQQCKKCNGPYIRPFIHDVENITRICIDILTNKNKRNKEANINRNTNTEFNSSHDQRRCQKCQIIGRPCWN